MKNDTEVIIVGGGLAGLIAAIHLKMHHHEVIVLEKNDYPKHKVCGEYISNEVLTYLKELNLDIDSLRPKKINQLSFSLVSGKTVTTKMPLGGFGVSRYTLDNYLFLQAKKHGVIIIQEMVNDIIFLKDTFTIHTNNNQFTAKIVIGAFGKRSNLDIKLKRSFIQKSSNWLGVKAHYTLDFPDNLVGLHHFNGGYCGVSKIENNLVNICYLANYDTFKQFKNIQEYQEKMIIQNPNLRAIFEKATLEFEKPLTISQISFEKKKAVEHHVLMIGDTAGLIHPLCGNGMAMAIHSAKLVCGAVIQYLENKSNRSEMEEVYQKTWNTQFKSRLKFARLLGFVLQHEKTAQFIMKIILFFPFLLPMIVKRTHGKMI
jgi:menaquinone-9 beta-reductase